MRCVLIFVVFARIGVIASLVKMGIILRVRVCSLKYARFVHRDA